MGIIANDKRLVEAIIETPKGSRNKYIWDEERMVARFKKSMPLGFVFPFDFGMVPYTKAGDGDPIDVLLLIDAPVYPGIFMKVRIIGALKADQKKVLKVRNDRLIAVEPTCPVYGHINTLAEMPEKLRNQIENFFRSYNAVQGKEFTPLGWADETEAMELIRESELK